MAKKPRTAFQPRLSKQPHLGALPHVQKTPIGVIPTTLNDEHPSWRIARLDLVDPYGWNEIGEAKIHEIRKKLSDFESMTWNDILVRGKKQNHSVEAAELSKAAQDRLVEMKLDHLDVFVSLRLSGAERVWGYRIGAVLHIIWWDPDHQVCPSLLKHT